VKHRWGPAGDRGGIIPETSMRSVTGKDKKPEKDEGRVGVWSFAMSTIDEYRGSRIVIRNNGSRCIDEAC
jgi:hypothetical protein